MAEKLFGWLGPDEAVNAWNTVMWERFPKFEIVGKTEYKRTCAWEFWEKLGQDVRKSPTWRQEDGDCVSYGGAKAIAGVMAYEIVVGGEWEQFHWPFPPYLYGISRLMPEGGQGRLGNSAGSLGSWLADTVVKYGVLRHDYDGVPPYSGAVARQWGTQLRAIQPFIDEADNHLIRTAARIRSAQELKDALCNGYFCTIASSRGFAMDLKVEHGKGWYVGRDTWMHQQAYTGYDTKPFECVKLDQSWGEANGPQPDGPPGGWRKLEDEDAFLKRDDVECFAFSIFDGFPSEKEKPRNWFA